MTRVPFARSPRVSPTANPVGGLTRRSTSMYVPAPPAQPAVGLAPVGADSATYGLTAPKMSALTTTLAVRSSTLNVLDGRPVTVSGALLARALPGGLPG